MNNLKALLKSPLSVKLLILFYLYSIGSNFEFLLREDVVDKLGWSGFAIPIAVAATFLILIFFRVSWSWIAGLLMCLYNLSIPIRMWISRHEVLTVAGRALENESEISKIPSDQIGTAVNLGFYGSMILLSLSALTAGLLWYFSRGYFKKEVGPKEGLSNEAKRVNK